MIRVTSKVALSAVIFGVAMIVMTIVCTIAWETALPGKVYINTEDGDGGSYLSPGQWVGTEDGFPIVPVKQMMPVNSMNDPDELKMGWPAMSPIRNGRERRRNIVGTGSRGTGCG